MQNSLSIFDAPSDWLKNDVMLHGIAPEVKDIALRLGGAPKVSRLIGVSYHASKEWTLGRRPISLANLNKTLNLCNENFRKEMVQRIDSKEIFLSCKYSPHKLRFPKEISPDLAYCVGVILGDGSLAGNISNEKGNWRVAVFFDNLEHRALYDSIIRKELDLVQIHRLSSEHCYVSLCCSKVFHWFLRSYFGVCNGFKSSRIFVPQNLLDSTAIEVKKAFLQGLFDTDGTITKRGYVKYASTSKVIIDQVRLLLNSIGIETKFGQWLKAEKFLPLYTVELRSKDSVLKFARLINFRHPVKLAKLTDANKNVLVAPSSSGQGFDPLGF